MTKISPLKKKKGSKSNNQLIIFADNLPQEIRNKKDIFNKILIPYLENVNLIYTSLLPGPELEIAKLAYQQDIPYVAVIPYREYSSRWPKSNKNEYNFFLKKALKVFYIDRQFGYMSSPVDKYTKSKVKHQVDWLMDKINLSLSEFTILTYVKGLHTSKMVYFNGSISSRIRQDSIGDPSHFYTKFNLKQETYLDSNGVPYSPEIDIHPPF